MIANTSKYAQSRILNPHVHLHFSGSWAGPQCTGCFSPVQGDWRTDETLKEVVAKAVQELTSSIAKDFPADVANGPFVIDEILQFEQQVNSWC